MLWIELALHRNQVGESAEVGSLAVHHDAASLIDNLPAIYRGPGGDADGTLRPLVAVLETTTQSIDELISHLAERLDPDLTEDRWLPQLAALLGLPFDAELLARAQRSLLKGARAILAGRGALAGVHALLNAIFGARRFVVVDRSEQLAPIALGGGGFSGSRLPAFLGGPSVRVPKLNARLVLGTTPLCTADTADASLARPPELLVVIPASGTERRRYGAAVRRMLGDDPGGRAAAAALDGDAARAGRRCRCPHGRHRAAAAAARRRPGARRRPPWFGRAASAARRRRHRRASVAVTAMGNRRRE
ncbi:MAG: phage tail protein [Microvirga sp.]